MEIREYTDYQEDEIIALYSAVGWKAYTENPESLRKGYKQSLLILGAYEGKRLTGIIRVVGDGETIVFVQDILVHPEYRHKGIGTALLKAILTRYSHVRQIELVTDSRPETIAFYESNGLRKLSDIGCTGFMKI